MKATCILTKGEVKHPRIEDHVHLRIAKAQLRHATRLREATGDGLEHLLLRLSKDVDGDDVPYEPVKAKSESKGVKS